MDLHVPASRGTEDSVEAICSRSAWRSSAAAAGRRSVPSRWRSACVGTRTRRRSPDANSCFPCPTRRCRSPYVLLDSSRLRRHAEVYRMTARGRQRTASASVFRWPSPYDNIQGSSFGLRDNCFRTHRKRHREKPQHLSPEQDRKHTKSIFRRSN